MENLFADIIVPLPLSQTYTYSIPDDMREQIAVGKRVIVHFGASRFYTGIVFRLHNQIPSYDKIKPITDIIDEKPILLPQQLQLWHFMSIYYQASLGDVYKTALPSGFKIENESIVDLVPEVLNAYTPSRAENNVIELLNDGQSHKINEFSTSQIKHIKRLIILPSPMNCLETTSFTMPKIIGM
jgi:primosomal protein N' (replication factor Y)